MVTVASGDDAGIGADTGADARMSADAYAGAGERSMGVGVSARNWGWRHASRKDFALRHVDFDIRPGERVLLLGASGAGKSTLMAGLAGVLGGDDDGEQEGTLLVGGRDARKVRGVSGLVLQDPDAQTILERVGDDVAFGCENLGLPKDEIWQRARESLDIVGLDYMRFDHSTRKLSGGQRQRLALAGVLAMHPGLLLLDEPTANLDPDGVKEVHDAVKHVVERTGETLIVIEHHIDVWLDTVDRVIVLGKPDGNALTGGVIADGTPGEVFGTMGDVLAEGGAWVPGRAITPYHPERSAGEVVLRTDDLSFGREFPLGKHIDLEFHAGEVTALTGRNGVGKSTLPNALLPDAARETSAISQKLGRGRHTTREVTIFEAFGGRIADTPGFASLEANRAGFIPKENLEHAFPEFGPYLGQCQFTGCSHRTEKGCAVRQALAEGKLSQTRYDSYCAMYDEVKDVKDWQRPKV